MKSILKLLFSRFVLISLLIIIQLLALGIAISRFTSYFVYFYAICTILSVIAVIIILSGHTNPAYKIAWIIPIMLFPIFGGLFYLLLGRYKLSKRTKQKMQSVLDCMTTSLIQDEAIYKKIKSENPGAASQSRYIEKYAYSPIFQNTTSEYFPSGEQMFVRLLEELGKAEHYIFLEYFIIERGIMWNAILDILIEKSKQGVEVRVMYDDVGCLLKLPFGYNKYLEKNGIKCCVFNPFAPVLSLHVNNRDHRKIAVIDGHTAFTGGINLADEYINAYAKLGHWKDTAIMIKGDAVWSFTVMFLSLWNYSRKTEESYSQYRPKIQMDKTFKSDGYVQPFTDSPLDDEPIGETVYLNLINKAERYVYVTTPYLILSNEMTSSLISSAKRGIDIRIVTPYIGDRWFVHSVTRSNYKILIESGVQIYEYTPGFIHAKNIVVDDDMAVVGTINLDYRSLYLHFECGVWLYHSQTICNIKEDFLDTLEKCQRVTLTDCNSIKVYRQIARSILRVFAPLM